MRVNLIFLFFILRYRYIFSLFAFLCLFPTMDECFSDMQAVFDNNSSSISD